MPATCLPVPHLEQSADGDCLPTRVAMILAYLHEPVDVARIAHLLDTEEFGGLDDDTVWVNDPAFPAAPQTIPVGDFLLAWAEFDNRYAAITRR